jgi:Ankyrin repeats (3 copies)
LLINTGKVNVNDAEICLEPSPSLLHTAASGGNKKIVQLLLNAGACIFAVDNNGDTAAQVAFQNNHRDVFELIEGLHLSPEDTPLPVLQKRKIAESEQTDKKYEFGNMTQKNSRQRFGLFANNSFEDQLDDKEESELDLYDGYYSDDEMKDTAAENETVFRGIDPPGQHV